MTARAMARVSITGFGSFTERPLVAVGEVSNRPFAVLGSAEKQTFADGAQGVTMLITFQQSMAKA
jgi:pyruvate/2-oxoglutarate dehydrogenase complex dihydrolipoamide acyltransferase (E2) component